MRRETAFVTLSVCLAFVAASAVIARGGPLDPPDGPVTSTYKTLDQVEPRIPVGPDTTPGDADSVYKISQSGTYYLTGNLFAQDDKHAIEIAAAGVTLDLAGHDLFGFVFGGSSLSGIRVTQAGANNIVIRNGSIRAFTMNGVDVALAASVRIEGVDATSNTLAGFRLGDGANLLRCHAVDNLQEGFYVTGEGAMLEQCVARANGGSGFRGFGDARVLARACRADENGAHGFDLGLGANVIECSAAANGADGIALSQGAVTNCVASDNGDDGIDVAGDGKISGNSAFSNGNDGIEVGSDCLVMQNACNQNGVTSTGAGIRAQFDSNRIDSNHVVENDRGLSIDGAGNLIVRNAASLNGINYSVVGGNDLGTIRSSPIGADAWDNLEL